LIERALSNAWLYEFVQTVTGTRISEAKMRAVLGPVEPTARILDAGGGTGLIARVFDRGRDYCCMDVDLARLRVAVGRGATAIQGDASRMPVATSAIDVIVMRAVSHHLDDAGFEMMIAEARRVLKPNGRLLFLDAAWAPSWLPGRLMWRIDQGSHPRTIEHMRTVLENHFAIERQMAYSMHHRYLLVAARPKG